MIWAGKPIDRRRHGYPRRGRLFPLTWAWCRSDPPLSLVTDDLGIYYDPSRPSRLEKWIETRATLRLDQELRAARLIRALIEAGLSKYNTGKPPEALPEGHRILVCGQVGDDASIRTGTSDVTTNQALLDAVRAAHPDAIDPVSNHIQMSKRACARAHLRSRRGGPDRHEHRPSRPAGTGAGGLTQ